jgi:uncharacterized protein
MDPLIRRIAQELSLGEKQVANTLKLLDEGATVPFVARYRKEQTGALDEVAILAIRQLSEKLRELEKRRETVLKSIDEQGKLTDVLRQKIEQVWTLGELEDLYLPFRPKRKTRASKARDRGLEPLAATLFKQLERDPYALAQRYLNEEVPTADDALQGARDILAEWVSEDAPARDRIRGLFKKEAVLTAAVVPGKESEGDKYRDYFAFSKKLKHLASHQLLAVRRAENEGILRLDIAPDEETAFQALERLFLRGSNESSAQVREAVRDSYKRLVRPSIETEFRLSSKEWADQEAIGIFSANLRQLLLAAPLGEKRVLALDPGFRSGCKVVCLDEQGQLLADAVVYPHPPQFDGLGAARTIEDLISKYRIEAIAIGNGTAGRETESFVRSLHLPEHLSVFMVSENGASVYSASEAGREEFPHHDVTVRGAVSIGRRLVDPLAELVKIDPKSIGVGQYQHDVDPKKLQAGLDSTVESCVNLVGVNLNTASKHLLTYVSGLGPSLAQTLVEYRHQHGPFRSRTELKKVPRLGPKAFEQCAGFLRIRDGAHPLDRSAVHPESYGVVEKMAKDLGCTVADLIQQKSLRQQIDPKRYIDEKTGIHTLRDILQELEKPGLDPREPLVAFAFDPSVKQISDLREGMVLPGIVTNITAFGAFVDIGIKQNGLVHKSQIAHRYVDNPADFLKVHQTVRARIISIDPERNRINLSLLETS